MNTSAPGLCLIAVETSVPARPAIVVVLAVAFLTTLIAGPAVAVAAVVLGVGTVVAAAIFAPLIAVATVHAAVPDAGRQAQKCDDGTENSNSMGGSHGACSCMNQGYTMAHGAGHRRYATEPAQQESAVDPDLVG